MNTTATVTLDTIPESAIMRAKILDEYLAANDTGLITAVSRKTGEPKSTVSRVWNLQYGTGKWSRVRSRRVRSALIREVNRWLRKSVHAAA